MGRVLKPKRAAPGGLEVRGGLALIVKTRFVFDAKADPTNYPVAAGLGKVMREGDVLTLWDRRGSAVLNRYRYKRVARRAEGDRDVSTHPHVYLHLEEL